MVQVKQELERQVFGLQRQTLQEHDSVDNVEKELAEVGLVVL